MVVVVVVVQGVECPMAHLYEVDQLPLWKVGIMQTRSPALGFNMFYTILLIQVLVPVLPGGNKAVLWFVPVLYQGKHLVRYWFLAALSRTGRD